MKKRILDLISAVGTHPAFTLPPVSLFLEILKGILAQYDE